MEQKTISSDLIRGHIDTIILHTLLTGDKNAQQISDSIEEKSSSEYKINQATLYSSLKRIENLKFATAYWNDSPDGGRRKFFKLTDSGKSFVEENLNNWSYSRSVIDKLMDCQPQPIIKTQIIEKIVQIPTDNVQTTEKPDSIKENNASQAIIGANEQINDKTELEPQKDVNFRSILQGLIKFTPSNDEKDNAQVIERDVETNKTENKQQVQPLVEKIKLNDTLNQTEYISGRSDSGKIDFGDLLLKAQKEGYKLQVSSKNSSATKGTLLINKLNLISSLFIYFVCLVEFLCYTVIFGKNLQNTAQATLITLGVLTLFPLIRIIQHVKNPNRCSSKNVRPDSILTTAVIAFNLLLITFAATLLLNIDFNSLGDVLLYVAIPVTIIVDIFIYSCVKYIFSKNKKYYLKNQKPL